MVSSSASRPYKASGRNRNRFMVNIAEARFLAAVMESLPGDITNVALDIPLGLDEKVALEERKSSLLPVPVPVVLLVLLQVVVLMLPSKEELLLQVLTGDEVDVMNLDLNIL